VPAARALGRSGPRSRPRRVKSVGLAGPRRKFYEEAQKLLGASGPSARGRSFKPRANRAWCSPGAIQSAGWSQSTTRYSSALRHPASNAWASSLRSALRRPRPFPVPASGHTTCRVRQLSSCPCLLLWQLAVRASPKAALFCAGLRRALGTKSRRTARESRNEWSTRGRPLAAPKADRTRWHVSAGATHTHANDVTADCVIGARAPSVFLARAAENVRVPTWATASCGFSTAWNDNETNAWTSASRIRSTASRRGNGWACGARSAARVGSDAGAASAAANGSTGSRHGPCRANGTPGAATNDAPDAAKCGSISTA